MNTNPEKGWLEGKLDDPEFQRLLAREEFVELFLNEVDRIMLEEQVSRSELARRMKCRPSNITQIFRRTRSLTTATMVDMAFHLNLELKLIVERRSSWNPDVRRAWKQTPNSARERALQPLVHGRMGFLTYRAAGTGWNSPAAQDELVP